eukprot:265094_1
MAINYAIGQVFSLSAADLFCPDYDENTVREFNLKNNHPTGKSFGGNCNKIHRPEIDEDKVRSGDPYEYISDFSAGNVIACIAFSLLATCLAVLGVYHLCICFYDGFYHFIKKNAANNPRILHALKSKRKQSQNKIVLLWKKWNFLVFKHLYPDSKIKIAIMILSEVCEILMQCWALLIYGGVQSVSFSFVIANQSIFIKSFACIIGIDAILLSILWLLYAIKIKVKMLHGAAFQSIVFVFDMVFDFIYTIFPLTIYSGNASVLFNMKALATLHSENGIIFFSAFVAMTLLFQKCVTVLRSFDPVVIEQRARRTVKHNIHLIPYIETEYISKTVSTESDTANIQKWKSKQIKRRMTIGFIGILFLIFGITIITAVNQYTNNAYTICSNPSNELLKTHPELYYWNDFCSFKLTPFASNPPCDCRTLDIAFTDTHYIQYNFTKQHIISIMENFKMLTFLNLGYRHELILIVNHMTASGQLQLAKDLFHVQLTKNCFGSKNLNHISLYRMFLIDLDWDALSTLQSLQVLEFEYAIWNNPVNWDSIGKLTNLKYLNLRDSERYLSGIISDSICNLKQLKYLDLSISFITSIPDCIGDLTELYGVNFRGMGSMEYITPNLFRLPNIISIVAYFSFLNASSIPADGKWSKSLKTIFLQENPVCNQLNTLNPSQIQFMDNFQACFKPCAQSSDCSTYNWGDGFCDIDCCKFDGGDCHQTCDCDRSLWFNDQCDLECNNTLCAYDFGDCLPLMNANN